MAIFLSCYLAICLSFYVSNAQKSFFHIHVIYTYLVIVLKTYV